MAIDGDEELLQDFLVEAEEILEQLGEQLIDLGKEPENKELLNSVFRGFHTIKGGALDSSESGNHVVVVNIGTQHIGSVVERLIGQEEVVIKPLMGAAITRNGRVSLILDVPGLKIKYGNKM